MLATVSLCSPEAVAGGGGSSGPSPKLPEREGNMSFAPSHPNPTWAFLKHDGLFGPVGTKRPSCFKRGLHQLEKNDGGPLSALEGPFELIKGPISGRERLSFCLEGPSVGPIRHFV